jgi:hypothetical protein
LNIVAGHCGELPLSRAGGGKPLVFPDLAVKYAP